jgi:L-lactate dehydrogenase complex protein LldG
MSAREAILSRIRRSLGVNGADIGRRAIVISRLDSAPRGIIPERGRAPQHVRVDLFCIKAEKVSASVSRVASEAEIPGAVAGYLRDHNLPAAVRMGSDPVLNGLPWDSTPQIEVAHGPSDGKDAVSVSHAIAGVAESGTIMLASGSENPTTLNFLPETHVVVLMAADIVGDYETAFDMIRGGYGRGIMPRTVNLITGPSRSADIEQSILLGAHGPRRLHLVIVG